MSRRQKALGAERQGRKTSLADDPALRELLDHVARQLAEEYVRLMKNVAREAQAEAAKDEVIR